MSVAETLLIYVGSPLLVTAVLAAFTLRPDAASKRRRYRPGQPWDHEPLWYAPHGEGAASGHGADTAAQPSGRTQAIGSSVYGEVGAGDGHAAAHGGSSGAPRALTTGATSASAAGAPVAGRGGPLGGAGGTW